MGTSTTYRTPLRIAFTLLAALSLIASQLVVFSAFSADASDHDEIPWTIDGAPDAGAFRLQDDCTNSDDLFVGGVERDTFHLEDPPLVVLDGSTATNQTDLCNVYVDTAVVDGDVYLYFAFERLANNGTQTVYLELGQNPQPAGCVYDPESHTLTEASVENCNPFANRVAGDLTITFNSQGSGGQLNLGIRTFDGTAFGPIVEQPASVFASALGTSGPYASGEAWLNLTDAGIFPDTEDTCLAFVNAVPYTQTGAQGASASQPKDIVLADLSGLTAIANCGNIKVTKQTVPSGFEDSFDIELLKGGSAFESFDLADGESWTYGTGQDDALFAGDDYSLVEAVPANWSEDYLVECEIDGVSVMDGDTFPVEVGKTTDCVVTNYPDDATITVTKTIDSSAYTQAGGDAGDLAGPDDFGLSVGGEPVTSGDGHDVTPGSSYTVAEAGLTGYEFVSLSCEGTDPVEGAETVQVTPGPGDEIECTFVNAPKVPKLRLVKILMTVGDDADSLTAEDFTLKIDDDSVVQGEWNELPIGDVTISEALPGDASAAGYELTGISCTNGASTTDADTLDVTLGLGDEITCTFTNSEVPPQLTLVKKLQTLGEERADLDAEDFVLNIDGDAVDQGVPETLWPDTFTVDEDPEDGYELIGIVCVDGDGIETAATSDATSLDVTLGLGDDVTCTFTNAELQPTVTLVKELGDTYGGGLDPADFDLELNGEVEDQGIAHDVDPGLNTVSEQVPEGYELASIACVDGDGIEIAATSDATSLDVDVELGDDITCTFTNDELQPTVTLVKELGDTYGGDLDPADFDLELNGVVEDQGIAHGVDAGTHTVSEQVPEGYELASIACVDGDGIEIAATSDATSLDVDVELGDDITCTFTNDELQPQLTLVKVISTDLNGPLAASQFTLNVDGDPVAQGEAQGLDAGTYRIDEDAEEGYELAGIICKDPEGTTVASTFEDDHLDVDLDLGDDLTCTFTNEEVAPTLTVLKSLGTTAGGTLESADFDLRIDGTSIVDYGEPQTLAAGSYLVDEVVPDGYAFVDIACDNDQSSPTNGLLVQLSLGQDVTCTITNDEIAPTLEVVKEVDNLTGGDLGPDDFQLYVAEDDGDPQAWDQGDPQDVTANRTYTVSEDAVAGYMHVGTECYLLDGDELGEKLSHPVTPSLAQDIRCIVTNEDVRPGLTINKIVENPHGGDLDSDDFTITVDDGDDVTQLPGGGTLDDPQSNVDYEIDELPVTGYELVDVECYLGDADEPFLTSTSLPVTVNLAPGEDAYCTVTNRDIAPTLILEKVVIDDVNGGATPQDFVLEVTPDGDATLEAEHGDELTLRSDTDYTLSEQQVAGYELLGIVCDNGESTEGDELTIGLTPGEVVTCTFTNEAVAPTLTVIKAVQGGPATPGDFTLLLNGDPIVGSETMEVLANTPYEISEEKVSQYVLISQVCVDAEAEEVDHPVVLAPGDEVVCHLVNAYAELQLDKTVVTVDGDEVAEGQVVVTNGAPVMLVDPAGGPYELTYEFTVTNTGEVALSNLTLTDPKLGGAITLDVDTIAPGETATGTATYTVTGEDLAAGSIPNTATATGEAPDGETIDDTDSVTVDLVEVLPEVLEPGISVEKTATDGIVAEEGDLRVRLRGGETAKVTYTYLVTNTGEEDLTDLTLVDDKIGDLSVRLLAAVTAEYGEAVLPAGASVTIEAVHEVGADDFDGDELTNVAVTRATGVDSGTSVRGEDTETVTLVEILEVTRPLPRTGADTTLLMVWGLLLTLLGAAALRWPRRRRGEA